MQCSNSPAATICRLAVSVIVLAALAACGSSGGSSKKFTIGGTISGLTGTVVLKNNGSDTLSRSSNGSFTFATKVKKGKPYAVTVGTQPVGQTCAVTNGSGTATANVTNVTVTCTTNPTFSVGGNVSGLTGTVVLRNNGGDDLSVGADGSFMFATKVPSGAPYAVTVFAQPTGQTCVVTQGTGTMPNANVTNVVVTCTNNPPPPVTYTIGGNVTGLTGTVVLWNNGGDALSVSANGPFTFPTSVVAGGAYSVTVHTQPAGQNCSVTNGTGNANANVTTVGVNCVAATTTYTIGGTITGLTGAGLKIENGPTRSASPASGATTFTLSDVVQTGFEYDVGISAQPAGQTCVILKSHGIVNNANVANVDVRCIAKTKSPLVGTYTVPALSSSNTSYVYITLFADGVYIYGSIEDDTKVTTCDSVNNGNGVEYGVYDYDAGTGAFTIKSAVVDTNGRCGVWDNVTNAARFNGTLTVGGSAGQSRVLTLTVAGGGPTFDLVPVDSTTGQITGSWAFPYEKNFVVFLPAGGLSFYDMVTETQQDTPPTNAAGFLAGVEYACASVSALTGGTLTPDFTATCQPPRPSGTGAVDLTGGSGLSSAGASVPFTINVDTFTSGALVLTRIKPN
jgi:hypothetical protein